MTNLLEYFNVVDKNAVVRAAHQADPAASMSAFGLSIDEQNAVLSGNTHTLAEALGIDSAEIPVVHVPNTVFAPTQQIVAEGVTVH